MPTEYLMKLKVKQARQEAVEEVFKDAEIKIKLCLKESQKAIKLFGFCSNDWYKEKGEILGYKTSLECIQRTREKFDSQRGEE